MEEIYAVLAVMPQSSGRSSGQFEALCEALWAARDGPLKEERILSSLLRPQCDSLVSVYCSTALRLQRDHLLRSTPVTQGSLSVFSSDNEHFKKFTYSDIKIVVRTPPQRNVKNYLISVKIGDVAIYCT